MELTIELDDDIEPEVIKQIQNLAEHGINAKSYHDNLDVWILIALSTRTNQSTEDIFDYLCSIDELGIDRLDYHVEEDIEERIERLQERGIVEQRGDRWNTKDLRDIQDNE